METPPETTAEAPSVIVPPPVCVSVVGEEYVTVSVSVPVSGPGRIFAPDGSVTPINADDAGRGHFEPALTGAYRVESEAQTAEVYANYYDAAESNLMSDVAPPSGKRPVEVITEPAGPLAAAGGLRPLGLILTLMALLALLAESIVLGRKALRWGLRDA